MASAGPALTPTPVPLCVDLDGTLIKGDSLFEYVLALARIRPLSLLLLPIWLLQGRAVFKARLTERVSVAPSAFSFRTDVIDFLRREHAAGRPLVLVTAANQKVATAAAEHLGFFSASYGSSATDNLKGQVKADFLIKLFGEKGFEYVGDSSSDLDVWKHAKCAHVVGSRRIRDRASQATGIGQHFETRLPSLLTVIRSVRLHHWSKNLLIYLPLVLAHRFDVQAWKHSAQAFFAFGLCASGLYVINDLLDLHSDRCHPSKRSRPFASGEIPIWAGALGALILVATTLTFSFALDKRFACWLVFYALLTVLYSSHIKKLVLADVFVLASFYGLRIVAGAEISTTPLSHWFLVFCGFFFLSLAMAKRSSELVHARDQVLAGNSRRGYRVEDHELLSVLGVASSFCCVVILALYAHSPEVTALYSRPGVLLLICPVVLYWLSRIWLLAHRGELDEDPVTFAWRDRTSLVLGVACLFVLIAANARVTW
jgi:4-hydroxybenzoate polyprenyltransferase